MPKVSQIPDRGGVPAASDYLLGDQASGPATKTFKFSDLLTFIWTLANIPTGATSPITRDGEMTLPFVASGLVWTADSVGVNRNASMTAGVVYINGRRISIAAVTARTFTASRDTYIDILDNGDGTGTIVYQETTNNNTSPSLASNSTRIGIIITGATTIATTASINQGQEDRVLPIVSSIPYAVGDSLGNVICNRDPNSKLLGLRQMIANQGGITTVTDLTGLSVPFIVPTGRKIKAKLYVPQVFSTVASDRADIAIKEGATNIQTSYGSADVSAGGWGGVIVERVLTPTTGSHTYKATLARGAGSGTLTAFSDGSTGWGQLRIELE